MFQHAPMLYHKILTLGSCVAATLTEQLKTLDGTFKLSTGQQVHTPYFCFNFTKNYRTIGELKLIFFPISLPVIVCSLVKSTVFCLSL